MIVFFTWILTAIFFALQYSRERDYKIASLDSHLQMQNAKILECIDDGKRITPQLVAAIDPGDSLRVTVIDLKGNVLYDSNGNVKVNHADRQEVKEAIATGHGFTKRRVRGYQNANSGKEIILSTDGNEGGTKHCEAGGNIDLLVSNDVPGGDLGLDVRPILC